MRRVYARLTAAQRRILTEAAAEDVRAETSGDVPQERSSDLADLCRATWCGFVEATPSGPGRIPPGRAPVYADLDRDPQTRRAGRSDRDDARALFARAAVRCPTTLSSDVAAGPLDGVYRFTLSYADLRAARRRPRRAEFGQRRDVHVRVRPGALRRDGREPSVLRLGLRVGQRHGLQALAALPRRWRHLGEAELAGRAVHAWAGACTAIRSPCVGCPAPYLPRHSWLRRGCASALRQSRSLPERSGVRHRRTRCRADLGQSVVVRRYVITARTRRWSLGDWSMSSFWKMCLTWPSTVLGLR